MSTPDPQSLSQDQSLQEPPTIQNRLPVHTHHCRFCNHLLLSTTRDIASLPRRKDPAKDKALILPLPTSTTPEDSDPNRQEHYTILLSTTVPDRKATLVRREDGFEKRLFLRCGRCRVVVGYFLDGVLFPMTSVAASASVGEGEEGERKEKVVYLLPGALVETGAMGDEGRLKGFDDEWRGWRAEV
ncbi:hypothetical protein BDV32DRAFT_143828 [Aspergillus pseudonomiae]|uniref:STEEP1 domain-containing protein n=1 Tax=Aspergillus pseudonomiae TaxID=1506151 RepID=A0A5N7DRD1_9EURO|nr:uncharacterized protein BDV37DRAFT_278474 [Aspergillus pseudonomiae]KAB8266096.1 hypothetical protein BDV32DRAFT_143828 [Aspergillus pseudonomiae]KAE8408964.1 hypothetical protein BDV37DRAFT_278474 [Aspergillus pseudonomiae]